MGHIYLWDRKDSKLLETFLGWPGISEEDYNVQNIS